MIIPNQSQTTYTYALPDGSTDTGSKNSNIVNTEILTYAFTKVKTSDKTFLLEGEIATQTVTLTNNSQTTAIAPFFKDILSSGATYVSGSVIVNNVAQPTYDLTVGFTLPDIPSGGVATIKYQIISDNPLTITPVTNQAEINYSIIDPISGERSITENSNLVTLPIVSSSLSNVKSVDKAYAVQGDTLHYISVITNSGNTAKTALTFKDTVPTGTTFVSGSVLIDSVAQPTFNPSVGFALPDLAVGQSTTVEFDVTVN